MAYTIKELCKLRDDIMQAYGLDKTTASKVVGVYNGKDGRPDAIKKMMGGDLSPVPDALRILGVNTTEAPTPSAELKAKKEAPTKGKRREEEKQKNGAKRRKKEEKREQRADSIEGEVITDDELPPDLLENITEWVLEYCTQYKIENPQKIDARQWRSCCMYIGEHIKKSGILRDRKREAHEGGRIYNGEKVAALLALYDYICGSYKQIAFSFNFIRFAGISYQYFNDYDHEGLTSSSVDLRKKAADIQKGSITASIASGGQQTVGNIFLGKALEGMQESTRVEHISVSASPSVPELPVFSPSGGLIEELPNEEGGES